MVNLRGAHGTAFKGKKTCQKSLQEMTFLRTENHTGENLNLYFTEAHDKTVGLEGTNTVSGRQNLHR